MDLEQTSSHELIAFDPRLLGLSDILSPTLTREDCLNKDGDRDIRIAGEEELSSISTYKVTFVRQNAPIAFWIEEPGFRVHRRTVSWSTGSIVIDSTFDGTDSVIPTRVAVKRNSISKEGETKLVFERDYDLISAEWNVDIPPDRFSLASFDLPVGTAINDYRTNQITGWDGEKISDKYISAKGKEQLEMLSAAVESPSNDTSMRYWLIVVNAIVVCLLALVAFRRAKQVKPISGS